MQDIFQVQKFALMPVTGKTTTTEYKNKNKIKLQLSFQISNALSTF